MDWYAWLCRAGLHPDLALEYALLFARNELGAADVRHLDHEFLASMGVAVAKHRLEILKLARRETSAAAGKAVAAAVTALPRRATRLLANAVHRSARSVLGRLRSSSTSTPHRDRAAVVVAPTTQRLPPPPLPTRYRGGGGGGGGGRVAHWNKVAFASSPLAAAARGGGGGKLQLPLPLLHLPMLTTQVSGKPPVLTNSGSKRRNSTAPAPAPAAAIVSSCLAAPGVVSSCDEADDDDDDTDDGEDMQWESMFQDLKPT